jgi:hypothetical protein
MSNDDFYRTSAILRGETLHKVGPAAPVVNAVGNGVWTHNPTPAPVAMPRSFSHAAAGVDEQVKHGRAKLDALRNQLKSFSDQLIDMDIAVARMTNSLHGPGSELADANEKIERLEARVAALIKEAQRQKRRAERAEIQQPDIEKSKPGEVAFLRRTPGDAIRYFATEVMKHGELDINAELMGAAMGLRMVADEVDRLPQG